MREGAKADEEERLSLFSTTLVMKLCLLVFGAALIIFVAPFFSTLPGAKELLPLVALILAFDTIREFLSSYIRSREKMEWEAAIFLSTNTAIVIFGFIFLSLATNARSLAWGYVAGTALGAVMAMVILRRSFRTVVSHFSARLVGPLMRSAWPFAITGALGLLLTNTDILIISWMRSASEVGIYSAAIRVIQIFYLVPSILQLTTLPLFSRLANRDDQKFRTTLERVVGAIFLISIPLALGGAILGTQVMALVFGDAYRPGGMAFTILMLTMLVDFPATIISGAIFAYDHQKSLIVTSAIGGIANVALDLALIPPFGIVGSAVATLIAQVLANSYLWRTMKRLNYFEVFPNIKKIISSGVIMGVATMGLFVIGTNVILNVLISGALYGLLLLALREPLLKEAVRIL
jgi:PST family polysaccharide transporter